MRVLALISSYLRVNEVPRETKILIQKYLVLVFGFHLAMLLSISFKVLYVIDLVGLARLGLLLAVASVVQAIVDYPTGVLGDKIGQRWMLFIAWTTMGISYLLLAFSRSFSDLLMVHVLEGVGFAFHSGSLGAWFDNNYKATVGSADEDFTTYMAFNGKLSVLERVFRAIEYLLGGLMATLSFRVMVFFLQALMFLILAGLATILVKDHPLTETLVTRNEKYRVLFIEGIKSLFLRKTALLFFIGWSFWTISWAIWMMLYQVPLVFMITGTDALTGTFFFMVTVLAIIVTEIISNQVESFNSSWYLVISVITLAILHFGGLALVYHYFVGPTPTFQLFPLILVFIISLVALIPLSIITLQFSRLFLLYIPDDHRHSVYSLLPTILVFFHAILTIFFSYLTSLMGIVLTLLLLGLMQLTSSFFLALSIKSRS